MGVRGRLAGRECPLLPFPTHPRHDLGEAGQGAGRGDLCVSICVCVCVHACASVCAGSAAGTGVCGRGGGGVFPCSEAPLIPQETLLTCHVTGCHRRAHLFLWWIITAVQEGTPAPKCVCPLVSLRAQPHSSGAILQDTEPTALLIIPAQGYFTTPNRS